MDKKDIKYNYARGCTTERKSSGELICSYSRNSCKLGVFNWLEDVNDKVYGDLYEVRFKNTRKGIYRNAARQIIRQGDIVVVEAATGHDVGIVTLCGPIVGMQLKRHRIDPETYEFKKIYRKAKTIDIERWQEAIAREHDTMIRSRQIAAAMKLEMKIGDVEFQGDGTKAIFYYIADERVDFRQLIKVFVEEFRIRIEMKQIGARQEAGLIGGIGACGQPLCCSRYMSEFKSITTFSAKCQDLSLNPQRLAGQCGKLKCCINYEAAVYVDAHKNLPRVNAPLEFEDGLAYLVKTDTLKGIMWFSYDPASMANMHPLEADKVREVIRMNRRGIKPESLTSDSKVSAENDFMSAVGEDSISRFDEKEKSKRRKKNRDNGKRMHEKSQEKQQASPSQAEGNAGDQERKGEQPRKFRKNRGNNRGNGRQNQNNNPEE